MAPMQHDDDAPCLRPGCAQARTDLTQSVNRYRWLIENSVDVIAETDADGLIRFASPAVERVLGYCPDEVVGTNGFALIHPDDLPRAREAFAYFLQPPGNNGPHVELRARHKNGSWRSVEVLGKNATGESHQSAVILCLRDITARKQVEAALTQRIQQLDSICAITAELTRELDLGTLLQSIHQHASELIAGTTGSIYLWDEAEQVLVCRVASPQNAWEIGQRVQLDEGLIGHVAAGRVGMGVDDYRRWPGARPIILERTRVAAAIAEPLLYRNRLVGVLMIAQEEPGHLSRDESRQLLSLFANQAAVAIENARLFTELSQSFQDLQQAQAALIQGEKLRALGQLAAGVAHNLNNILGAVLGQAELMRLHTTDPVILGALQLLCTAASDGARVLRRIQAFARRQSGEPHIPCDLATLVNEALDLTRPFWQDEAQRQRRPIQIWTALEGLPLVLGNPVEIREALTNLILNAADAMPTGGSLTIAGSSATGSGIRGAGEEVLITIRDTGIGMSQEVCQRIFEPFFTTKGPRGTGLGLALVYEIMDRHGGTIDVTSTLGRGTTFTLRFQAAQETRAPREEAAQPLVPLSRRLLVIDDEPNVRHTITAMLRVAGHTVFEAENGPEGLVVLAESPVDLVLTDLGMPGMTGWELAQKIKATHPQLPVVLLTGWDHPDPAGTLEQTGVDRVLAKPVRLEDLQVAIMECTSGKP